MTTDSSGSTTQQDNGEEKEEKLSLSLVQTISSELSTPLNIMLGYASLLYEGALGDLTPEQESAISSIVSRADGMRSLINRLNILMEAEAGLGNFTPINFSDLLKQVLASKSERMAKAGLALQMPPLSKRYPILGNQTQIAEMLNSLLDNAIKFTPHSGKIFIELKDEASQLKLCVQDTGIGITENALQSLFSSFRQTSDGQKQELGLGLSIVRAVAQRHGGEVKIESKLGEGTRVTLELPLATPDQAKAAALTPPAKHRVLIVDDDKGVSFTFEHALQKIPNCEVVVANSGEEALKYYAKKNFDMVFTDYKMPNMNGIELTQAMRVINPEAIIILVTAFNNSSLRAEAEKLDVHGYLKKPLEIKDIRNTVRQVLDQKEKR